MNVIETLAKPTLAGITASAITRYVTYGNNEYGNPYKLEINSQVPFVKMFNGNKVNLVLMTGVAVGIASLTADIVSDKLFDFLTADQIMENIGSTAFQLGAVSAGTTLVHGVVNSQAVGERGLLNIIGLATATELIASYTHAKFVRPLFRNPEEPIEYVL
jgi:hypothetical protein